MQAEHFPSAHIYTYIHRVGTRHNICRSIGSTFVAASGDRPGRKTNEIVNRPRHATVQHERDGIPKNSG